MESAMPLEVSNLTKSRRVVRKILHLLGTLSRRAIRRETLFKPRHEARQKSYGAVMNKPLGDLHIVHFRMKDILNIRDIC